MIDALIAGRMYDPRVGISPETLSSFFGIGLPSLSNTYSSGNGQ